MNASDVRTLIDYYYWANARLWRALLQVTPEQFAAPNTSSHGSLRGTLVHTLFAEMIWRRRLQGEPQPTGFPVPADFPTPQALCEAWSAEEKRMRAMAASLTDEFLHSTLDYRSTKGAPYHSTVWHILVHMVNHGTQHRAEAAAMLTDLGHSPGDIDMIFYFREQDAR